MSIVKIFSLNQTESPQQLSAQTRGAMGLSAVCDCGIS